MANIRRVTDISDIRKVQEFRYRVYVEELGRAHSLADHDDKLLAEQGDYTGRLLAAFDGDEVVGTLRNNTATEFSPQYRAIYGMGDLPPEQCCVTSRWMVSSWRRHATLGLALAKTMYEQLLIDDLHYDFIDVYKPLVRMFRRMGFVEHIRDAVHPDFGEVTIMKLDLRDEAWLRSVNSPLLPIFEQYNQTTPTETFAAGEER